MRPRQWPKNLLVFVGLLFSLNLTSPTSVAVAVATFVLFCALSSAGYLLNDLADVEADRQHPRKALRPIAAGYLSMPAAGLAAALLAAGGLAAAFLIRLELGAVALLYLLVTLGYSLWLKHLVLIDVFALSAGFVVRAAAGAVAIGVPISPWLYVCTVLGSLFIALGKRRHELVLLEREAFNHRRTLSEYSVELVDQLLIIVSSATIMAYSLYTFSADNLPRYHFMMFTIPFVLYGVFRYLYLIHQKGLGGAPEDLLLGDRPLAIAVVGWGMVSTAILYLGAR
ncbi:MAG: decaprenyl-phosphate phosphoribosyltransferase [Chloroflexi bacterium]|nr:decaprenyl-phosphate phosphoribosyltransferase [Chloroflexota bacterium]